MKVIDGLNYYDKLQDTIKECITLAKQNPFEQYIFIAEDKHMVEELFLEHIHYLVNIQIMTWKQFINYLQITLRLTKHHVINDTRLTYLVFKIFKENNYNTFPKADLALVNKIIPLLKDFSLYKTHYVSKTNKLQDLLDIYKRVYMHFDEYTHLNIEEVISTTQFNLPIHLFVEGDHLTQPLYQDILSMFDDVTILYSYEDDERICNIPYKKLCLNATHYTKTSALSKQLYLNNTIENKLDIPAYTFIAPTPLQEVTRVIYTIKQMIVDEGYAYKDFAIVYPDESYTDILRRVLKDTPNSLPYFSSPIYQSTYRFILNEIDQIGTHSISEYANAFINKIKDTIYLNYFENIKDFEIVLTPEEFKEFFINTFNTSLVNQLNTEDLITIASINQYKSSTKKHIFYLGLNDTILPHLFKNRNLLLDEDIESLRASSASTPPTTLEQYALHLNSILKSLSQPALSMTFSYVTASLSGNTYAPSSLYKELKHLFAFKPLPPLKYIPLEELYLKGAQLPQKDILNKNIKEYIETKNQVSHLSPTIVKQLYSPTLSVSQIETYNKCPFLYFLSYGLNIQPLPEDKILPNELGSLVHHILSLNINAPIDYNQTIRDYLKEHKALAKKVEQSHFNQYCIEQLVEDTKTTIKVIQAFQSSSMFTTLSQEEKVNYTINNIPFKGFIDRIDTFEDYLAIIDYKSSAKNIDLNLALQGFNIQMLLYLYMATQIHDKKAAAVLYFNFKKRILSNDQAIQNNKIDLDKFLSQYKYGGYVIDDDTTVIQAFEKAPTVKCQALPISYTKSKQSYKGNILNSKQLDTIINQITQYIYILYEKMYQGNIDISPKGSSKASTHTIVNPCSYCPHRTICHFDIFYNEHEEVQFFDIEKLLGGEEDAV